MRPCARTAAGARIAPRSAREGDDASERARAPHSDRTAAAGKPDDPRGSVATIRHLARARPADRGPRFREIAESDQSSRDRAPPRYALSWNILQNSGRTEGASLLFCPPARVIPRKTAA